MPDLLHLKMFVHQAAQRLALDLWNVVSRRLDARGNHQQPHALTQVIGRDDFVIDSGHDALA
jgi:hypothetical protein